MVAPAYVFVTRAINQYVFVAFFDIEGKIIRSKIRQQVNLWPVIIKAAGI